VDLAPHQVTPLQDLELFGVTNISNIDVNFSLQRSVSVRSRAEVIIMHTPSTSDACETHAQPIEKSIASLDRRPC